MENPSLPQEQQTTKPKRTKNSIPIRDEHVIALADRVLPHFYDSPFTLAWMDKDLLEERYTYYSNSVRARYESGNSRSNASKDIQRLNELIEQNIKFVKNYILEEVGEDLILKEYTKFKIVKTSSKYTLPTKQEQRLFAIKIFLEAIKASPFSDRKYGTAFWQPIHDDYIRLMNETTNFAGDISMSSSERNDRRKEIQKVLTAIKYLIQAHHPDNYKEVWRSWGFLKEYL